MAKRGYLAHVREGTPLQGQEQAVTCRESKQEPPKAGLLPTAEISVPLMGKCAHRDLCPSLSFLCRRFFYHTLFSPVKSYPCCLSTRSGWWAGYCFPAIVSLPLLYLLLLLVHLELSGLSWETRRHFQSQLWRNFLALWETLRRMSKDH